MAAAGPRGVVFDFDGVIVRSMELHAEAYRRILAPHGAVVRDEDVFRLEGGRSETIIKDLLGPRARDLGPGGLKRLADEKQTVYTSLGPPQIYPGAERLVGEVRSAAKKLGLVTGTRRANLERLIPHLLPSFDAVLAQDAYQHDKPHPEPYLRSASALGLPPSQCAALENAPRGVESAVRAGYGLVVAIPTTVEPGQLTASGAHRVEPDHAAAGRALVGWLRRSASAGMAQGSART